MPPTTPVKRKRGEGQWKLGHREPLNPNERTKKDDDGLNVRARIENSRMEEIFKGGLHEFIDEFINDNNELGAAISEQYLM